MEQQPKTILNTLSYLPSLDSLRAWAVLMVIGEHYFLALLPKEYHFLPLGSMGVSIFFTLSGFLISTILLETQETKNSKLNTLKKFYIRRFLRLFPVYYFTIIAAIIFFPVLNIKENAIYYFTYTTNFKIFSTGEWGKVGHFWSLAVEEQFYLFWPLFFLFIPQKYLLNTIIFFIISAPIFKIVCYYLLPQKELYWLLTPFNFDLLGLGALAAYIRIYKPLFWQKLYRVTNKNTIAIIILLAIFIISYFFKINTLLYSLSFYPCVALVTLLWIFVSFETGATAFPTLLNNIWLQQLGKISYGVYVYHLPIMGLWGFNSAWFISKGIDYEAIYWLDNPYVISFCCLLVTIVVSLLSYSLIEKPIKRLKVRFIN